MNRALKRVWMAGIAVVLFTAGVLPAMAASNVTIAITGDIQKKQAKEVSDLILAHEPVDAVLLVGDTCNDARTPIESYRALYSNTYDRLFPKVYPTPGNHDTLSTPPLSGYVEFWGAAAHPPELYYSFDLGGWHIVSIDGVAVRSRGAAAERVLQWLDADLAANAEKPVIAYWHYPLFSQGRHGGLAKMKPVWDVLTAHGPALVFNGHNHIYERYPPLTPEGEPAAASRGLQEFVLGPGGSTTDAYAIPPDGTPPFPVVGHGDAQHVGFFTLEPDSGFRFVVEAIDADGVVTTVDRGSGFLGRDGGQ